MSDQVQNIKIHLIGDADLSQVDASLNKLSASELKVKDAFKQVDAQAKATHKTLQEESAKSTKAVDVSSKSFTGLTDKVRNLASSIPGAFQVQEVLGFAKATQTATAGVGGMTTGMKALRVAIASTGIGAIVVALGSLIAYFKSTDEGATKLEGVMGALGAAFGEVVGFAAELGSKIFGAFESVANFREALTELGDFIVTNLLNRLKAPLVIFDALTMAFKEFAQNGINADFVPALKKAADGIFQLGTGVADITTKAGDFAERLAKAAKEAYDYAIKLDAVNDAQREFNVTISENNIKIVELIRQSKNHTLAIDERIKKLQEANKLDEQNLKGQLEIENRRLALIQERNARERAAINQRLNDDIAEAKSEEAKLKLKEKALSISDDLADEEANQIIKINGLRQQSVALQERNNNSIAALTEEGIQKRLALIKSTGTAEENIYKEQYAKREIDEKQFQDGIQRVQLESLYTQKGYLESLGRDTIEIDKAIQDILVKQSSDADKALLDQQKKTAQELADEKKKEYEDDYAFYSALSKKKIEQDKIEADQRKQIKEKENQLLSSLANGLFTLQKENLDVQLQQLQYNQAQELAAVGDNKQGQAAINAKFAKETAEIKRKQAIADKDQAIFNISLSTIQAVAKASPVVPLMALAAAIGAAQLAFAVAKPIPKFYNKGTKSVEGVDTGRDSVYAMLRPGEGVMPVDRMNDYRPAFDAIFDRKIPADLINSIAMNPDIIGRMGKKDNDNSGIERHLEAIENKLDKIKTFEVSMDAKGFKTYLKGESSKSEIENNYARMK
jgi:hypothetical protein